MSSSVSRHFYALLQTDSDTLLSLREYTLSKLSIMEAEPHIWPSQPSSDACHEKTDLKVFVVVIPKEGWARVAAPILLLV